MQDYEKVNINLKELEKDYWINILKDYIKHTDNTRPNYISNKYKDKFMKKTIWIPEYKISLAKNLWTYWTYLFTIDEYAREDNSIDMNIFKESIWLSDNQINRLIKAYKENWVLKKSWNVFYLNPLIVYYWRNIKLELGILFQEELKKVWITIK